VLKPPNEPPDRRLNRSESIAAARAARDARVDRAAEASVALAATCRLVRRRAPMPAARARPRRGQSRACPPTERERADAEWQASERLLGRTATLRATQGVACELSL